MRLLRVAADLEPYRGCALVPTMGALHAGHAALIAQAARAGLPVVATIFVNPTQFAPHEDFAAYPRTLQADLAAAEAAGAAAVFLPDEAQIYPHGLAAAAREAAAWPVPRVAREPRLEDAARPTHFGGVCQVVARLFDLAMPAVAVFGEKDYQQLRVLTALVAEQRSRWPHLRIEAAPTVREPDGLAMSSRNRYLRAEQREQALGLVRALQMAASAQHPRTAEDLMRQTLDQHGLQTDYAVVRDAASLEPVEDLSRPSRALIAARLSTVRLIDNMALPVWR
jgi:pantoate--beta-alanine ligase